MPRSPSDATRFTATGPYASTSGSATEVPQFGSNQGTTGSRIAFGAPAPENETAQQKIARLRAAAALSKRAQESQSDKVIRIGRAVADRAHRITALGLIGATVITACVATAGITDMLVHNRRRRNEWLAEKQAQSLRDLAEAKRALAQGAATEYQVLLMNRERAAMEAEEARRNRPGVFKRTTGWLFGGAEKVEQRGGRMGVGAKEEVLGEKEDIGVLKAVEEKVEQGRRGITNVVREETAGGPLDREAQKVADVVTNPSKGWMSWITGR